MNKLILSLLFAGTFPTSTPVMAGDQADAVVRGEYQAILGDCGGCHTKKGGAPLAGGAALETPFGPLVPPNITPDPETGIGKWSEDDFIRMMKTGIGHGGKRLYPAMPYTAYTKMSHDDLSDLWDYLLTVEPVPNAVEANQLPFPFNIRLSLFGWNLLNFTAGDYVRDPAKTDEWNRGAYLVQGAGHCAACHSPKTFLGGDKNDQFLEGGSLQGWFAPNITGDKHLGIGGWSDDELVAYLKTGANSKTIASGPMAEAVENSTSHMTKDDLRAIGAYLKSIPGSQDDNQAPVSQDNIQFKAGANVYHDTCSACHGLKGEGAMPLFPALAGNPIVNQDSAETLARLVVHGSQGAQTSGAPTKPSMPSLGWRLSDQQIADVLTYVRNEWGNHASVVNSSDIAKVREQMH